MNYYKKGTVCHETEKCSTKLHISMADKEAIYNECVKENVDPNKVIQYAVDNGFSIRNTPDYLISFFKLGKDEWYNRAYKSRE